MLRQARALMRSYRKLDEKDRSRTKEGENHSTCNVGLNSSVNVTELEVFQTCLYRVVNPSPSLLIGVFSQGLIHRSFRSNCEW